MTDASQPVPEGGEQEAVGAPASNKPPEKKAEKTKKKGKRKSFKDSSGGRNKKGSFYLVFF